MKSGGDSLPLRRGSGFKRWIVAGKSPQTGLPLRRGSGFKHRGRWEDDIGPYVSLCVEGVDLNERWEGIGYANYGLPLRRGSGFKPSITK